MNENELKEILRLSKLWNETGGKEGIRADLRGTDLRGADLSGAYLRGADLRGANMEGVSLRGAKGIQVYGPAPSSGRMVYAVDHGTEVMMQAGCFWDTTEELRIKAKKEHTGKNLDWYLAVCDMAEMDCWKE